MIDDVLKGIFSMSNEFIPDSEDRCHDQCGTCTGGCDCGSYPEYVRAGCVAGSHSGTEGARHVWG